MDKIIDGVMVSRLIKDEVKSKVEFMDKKPTLAVIQVGNDLASTAYISGKKKACLYTGINFKHIKYDENITEEEVIEKVEELNLDDDINGILVQLPLPNHIISSNVLNAIDKYKDVDGLSDSNILSLVNDTEGMTPCTPTGIIRLLEYYDVPISGSNVVIVGRSRLVGKPLFNMLLNRDATVTICHSKTKNLGDITKNADILIVAVGRPKLINSDMVKKGAVVIDVGINRVDGILCGDVLFDEVYDKVSLITPVPKGVGPMTVALLMENTIKYIK